jgi:hypothetical protein
MQSYCVARFLLRWSVPHPHLPVSEISLLHQGLHFRPNNWYILSLSVLSRVLKQTDWYILSLSCQQHWNRRIGTSCLCLI